MARTQTETTIPTMDQVKEDAWALANIPATEDGLKQAQQILAKYEKAVNAMPELLGEGKNARDYFNVLKDLDEKVSFGEDGLLAFEGGGNVGYRLNLIGGMMHMMSSMIRRDLAVTGYEARDKGKGLGSGVADAAYQEEEHLQKTISSMLAGESGHEQTLKETVGDIINKISRAEQPARQLTKINWRIEDIGGNKTPNTDAKAKEPMPMIKMTMMEKVELFLREATRVIGWILNIKSLQDVELTSPKHKAEYEQMFEGRKSKPAASVDLEAHQLAQAKAPATPGRKRSSSVSKDV